MRLKYIMFLVLACGLILSSCQKDDENNTNTEEDIDYGEVVANFEAKTFDGTIVTSIEMGEMVLFHDISAGNPDKRKWTFDGAVPETDSNIVTAIRYPKPGKYKVKLMVERSSDGEQDEMEVEEYINIQSIPVEASFVTNIAPVNNIITIKTGDYVNFTNTSAGVPETFEWAFGGGTPTTSTQEVQEVRYVTPGLYDVQLIARRNDNGVNVEDDTIRTAFVNVEERIVELRKAVYNQTQISLTFSEPMMSTPQEALADFSVSIETAGGATIAANVTQIQPDAQDSKKLLLTIDQSTYTDDKVTVALSTKGNLKDATLLSEVDVFSAVCSGIYNNILDPVDYGLENDSWWIQHKDFWSLTNEIVYEGTKAIKYEIPGAGGNHKAFGPTFKEEIPAGEYYIYFRIYVVSGSINKMQTQIRLPWHNFVWSGLGTLPKGRWVELKKKVTLKNIKPVTKADITLKSAPGGVSEGVVLYVDDIGIFNTGLRP